MGDVDPLDCKRVRIDGIATRTHGHTDTLTAGDTCKHRRTRIGRNVCRFLSAYVYSYAVCARVCVGEKCVLVGRTQRHRGCQTGGFLAFDKDMK